MKGYNTSKDYDLLWELIQQGYMVPGWFYYEGTPKGTHIFIRRTYWNISNCSIGKKYDKSRFLKGCIDEDLEFIPPTEINPQFKNISTKDIPGDIQGIIIKTE